MKLERLILQAIFILSFELISWEDHILVRPPETSIGVSDFETASTDFALIYNGMHFLVCTLLHASYLIP